MAASIKFSGKGQPGNLLDPNNWVGGVVPGPTSSALIDMNVGAPVTGTFSVNNLMMLAPESITFAGTLDTAGVGVCQGLMICEGATATFSPGAILNDGGVLIVGNDAVGAMVAQGAGTVHSVINTGSANIGKQDGGIGTFTINDAIWNNSGHAFIGDDGSGTLNVLGASKVTFSGGVDMADEAGSHGVMTIATGASVSVGLALCVGEAASQDAGTASVSVAAGASLTTGNALEVGNGGLVTIAGGTVTGGATASCVYVQTGGEISGYGLVTTRAGAAVDDDGTILASGGTLTVNGNVGGEGSIQIAANSSAQLTGAGLGLSGIAFIGPDATLSLAHGVKAAASISGFGIGDIIEMANVDAVSFNATTGNLTLSDQGLQVSVLHLAGSFAGDTFAVTQSANGAMITLHS
jgi:T5SS/PEP-CTERM-associated repeat protein